jgi:hypothetical protein
VPSTTLLELPPEEQAQRRAILRRARYGYLLAFHILLLYCRGPHKNNGLFRDLLALLDATYPARQISRIYVVVDNCCIHKAKARRVKKLELTSSWNVPSQLWPLPALVPRHAHPAFLLPWRAEG